MQPQKRDQLVFSRHLGREALAASLLLVVLASTRCGPTQATEAPTPAESGNQALGRRRDEWLPAPPMSVAREYAKAIALLDGRILVTGGRDYPTPHASAEIYDPASNSWRPTSSMNEARVWFAAAPLQDGKVLVAGGDGREYLPLASAEIYDPSTEQWITTNSLLTARSLPGAVLLRDGRVLVIGGIGGEGRLYSAEVYDPETERWSSAGSTTIQRGLPAAIVLPHTGDVLVVGSGEVDEFHFPLPLPDMELYHPESNSWTMGPPMNVPRWIDPVGMLLPSSKVLIAGGEEFWDGGRTSELYDPDSSTWTRVENWNHFRMDQGSALLSDGRVLIVGGWFRGEPGGVNNNAEVYEDGRWELIPMAEGRVAPIVVALPNGRALVAGGSGLSSAEVFAPLEVQPSP